MSDTFKDYQKHVMAGWTVVSSGSVFSALVDAVMFHITDDEKYKAKLERQQKWAKEAAELAFKYVAENGRFTDAFSVIAMEANSKNGRGMCGQFFTPTEASEFVGSAAYTDLSYSKLGATSIHVLEPTCGTGAMIFGLLRAIEEITPEVLPLINVVGSELSFAFSNAFYANVLMNEKIHGLANVSFTICSGDTLTGNVSVIGQAGCNETLENVDLKTTMFDLVIGNPPFGKISVQPEYDWLRSTHKNPSYEIADFIPSDTLAKTAEAEKMFIDLAMTVLRPDGVMGFIIPNSILSNTSSKNFRKYLMTNHSYRATVSFPKELFVKTGTTVNTSLMLIKNSGGLKGDSHVFMAVCEKCGWDSRARDTTSDFPEVKDALCSFLLSERVGAGVEITNIEVDVDITEEVISAKTSVIEESTIEPAFKEVIQAIDTDNDESLELIEYFAAPLPESANDAAVFKNTFMYSF
jgi:hypothetical protein